MQSEIDKFNNLAHEWWNPKGKFQTLHDINPIRLNFIKKHLKLNNMNIIDIGCGGGILSEALATNGANVTAIDLAPQSIEVAKLHLYESHLKINYQCTDSNSIAKTFPEFFDAVICMEMLEHVDSIDDIISDCATMLKSNQLAFFSTINRTIKSFFLGIVAAEHILKIVPKNSHTYSKFIKPSELNTILEKHNLKIIEIKGLIYNPFTHQAHLSNNLDINYFVVAKKLK